jgi:hypothetical protein
MIDISCTYHYFLLFFFLFLSIEHDRQWGLGQYGADMGH